MPKEKTITVTVELPEREAEALAQMVKRMSFDDLLKLAAGHPKAHDMLVALLTVKRALADKGYAPRCARTAISATLRKPLALNLRALPLTRAGRAWTRMTARLNRSPGGPGNRPGSGRGHSQHSPTARSPRTVPSTRSGGVFRNQT